MNLNVNNDTDLKKLLKNISKGNWLIWYYADWCGHCIKMKKVWEDFTKKCKNTKNNSVNLAKVNDQYINKLNYDADVYGFPTIKLYQNGNNTNDFNLNRTADNLFKFLKLNNLVNSKKVKSKRSKKKSLSQKRKRYYNRSKVNK